ncbi:hypothetical protein BDM02DRAFT_3131354 [Thelephora ganbajun]|uniref:Uncharacterized protein n=1 Tax=Thelephora ganbajun TaxID=370292 RepID=A0ACB6Z664_THEGA|nr:hypothetical protein BDM02DRAFT_3131354 [Thelephora ganbajun]
MVSGLWKFGIHSALNCSPPFPSLVGSRAYLPIQLTDVSLPPSVAGGVAKEIDHCGAGGSCLVWSLDGSAVAIVETKDTWPRTYVVHTYNVTSGAKHSPGTLESVDEPHLWADGTSFRVMTTRRGDGTCTINIFEAGSILTEIESFHIGAEDCIIRSFSQTTHRISCSRSNHLVILNIRSSRYLLEEEGRFYLHCFSPDGSLFAASEDQSAHIWKYTSGRYARWRKFSIPDLSTSSLLNSLRFSPTSSSLLGRLNGILKLWCLDGPPIDAHHDSYEQVIILSRCGGYIVAYHRGDCVVTITNLLSQTLPCVIDTGMAIGKLALTGNILLVLGSNTIAAWRLTEEGMVDGVCADGRTGRGSTIWTIPVQSYWPDLLVQDKTAVIEEGEKAIHAYHTESGEALELVRLNPPHQYHDWSDTSLDDLDIYGWDISSEGGGPLSWNSLQEGWVKCLEGNRLLWLPIEWRNPEYIASRSYDSTVVWLHLAPHSGTSRTVIIKF